MHTGTIIFSSYAVSYLSFLSLLVAGRKKNAGRFIGKEGITAFPKFAIATLSFGLLMFGIIPLLSNDPLAVLDIPNSSKLPLLFTSLLILITCKVVPLLARKTMEGYTGPVNTNVLRSLVTVYIPLRIVFIAIYEIWFRGYFLHDCLLEFGVVAAVILNIVLYAGLHVVNGKEEFLLALPFGILLCVLAIWMQSALPAIALHLTLTVLYEGTMMRRMKMFKTIDHAYSSNRRFRLPGL